MQKKIFRMGIGVLGLKSSLSCAQPWVHALFGAPLHAPSSTFCQLYCMPGSLHSHNESKAWLATNCWKGAHGFGGPLTSYSLDRRSDVVLK